MTAAKSSAALCSVSVSPDVLKSDLVLQLVLKSVQLKTHQVQVTTVKGKNTLHMTVSGSDSSTALTQRNTILRSLVGAALHGAHDTTGFFGAGASVHGTSAAAAVNAGATIQSMALAKDIRNGGGGGASIEDVMSELERVLEASAFLVPFSASASLADFDVAVALMTKSSVTTTEPYPKSVQRWMDTISEILKDWAKETGVSLDGLNLSSSLPSATLPVFFYGQEDPAAILSGLAPKKGAAAASKNPSKAKASTAKKGDASKQQQQGKTQAAAPNKKKTEQQAATTYDVTALDIRVGKIIKVWPHESADKLFCEDIDLGNGEVRQIASGLRPFYQDSDMLNRTVLVLCNLKKRNLVGFPSHGMVLCASNADHSAVEFVVPPEGAVLGERVNFGELSGDPEPENKIAKKKVFEQIAPDLKTDASGIVQWKTHVATVSTGSVSALNKMAGASVS